MEKRTVYDKTERITPEGLIFTITEKLDGSNLCFYVEHGMLGDEYLAVCQRKNIFYFDKFEPLEDEVAEKELRQKMYPGLLDWVRKNGPDLIEKLNPERPICCEWIGMGQVKYPEGCGIERHNPYMFAMCGWNDGGEFANFNYNKDWFGKAFNTYDKEDEATYSMIPDYIKTVPVVGKMVMNLGEVPNEETLGKLYDEYEERVGRIVEGFVISYQPWSYNRMKYVRAKNGKKIPFKFNDHKGE